jgi:hypothetical protein
VRTEAHDNASHFSCSSRALKTTSQTMGRMENPMETIRLTSSARVQARNLPFPGEADCEIIEVKFG